MRSGTAVELVMLVLMTINGAFSTLETTEEDDDAPASGPNRPRADNIAPRTTVWKPPAPIDGRLPRKG